MFRSRPLFLAGLGRVALWFGFLSLGEVLRVVHLKRFQRIRLLMIPPLVVSFLLFLVVGGKMLSSRIIRSTIVLTRARRGKGLWRRCVGLIIPRPDLPEGTLFLSLAHERRHSGKFAVFGSWYT